MLDDGQLGSRKGLELRDDKTNSTCFGLESAAGSEFSRVINFGEEDLFLQAASSKHVFIIS